ncbi:ABC transporter ATP-binding protein [Methylophaga sp.]|uniref:ABC transporter ATP-binding protein n=1 Tax=Methylophaga sp. TaxID=2024840 RepID=UPI003A8FA3C9
MRISQLSEAKNETLIGQIKRLYFHIEKRQRAQFSLLLILILFASVAEVVSIGAIIPFLGVLSAPQKVFDHEAAQPIIQFLNIVEPNQLLLPLTGAFAVAAIVAGAMRLLLLFAQTRLSYSTGHQLGVSIYQKTLFQPYSVHASRNSSEVINGIYAKASTVASGVILPVLTLISGAVMLSSVMIALLLIDPKTAVAAFLGFGLVYAIIIGLTRRQLLSDGEKVARQSNAAMKLLQEGLGSIRDILIYNTQKIYCETYSQADYILKRAQGNTAIIAQSPRYLMETIGILLMTVLAYVLANQSGGLFGAIPVLGSLALGAQRLLPVLQQGYHAWSSLRGKQASLRDILRLLDQQLPDHVACGRVPHIPFKRNIILKDVSFRYEENGHWILRSVNLTLAKGSRIGIVGGTGSGKTTLIDIVMGLLEPTEGAVCVDDTQIGQRSLPAWQKHIAHVPQAIFLADSSVSENIAFGVPKDEIDMDRVQDVARRAQIAETIEHWPDGYSTVVGERGIRLSGGQRQRIGIARALYRSADVIVFDEATSALDNETEDAVMEAIDRLAPNLTVLMIAHRYSTLRVCDEVIQVKDGFVSSAGSYSDFIQNTNR